MNRLFRTTVVETSGVRTISGGGTNASNAGQALANLGGVSLTGNQTISGIKTFASRPTVNGTGILLSGEGGGSTSLPNTIVYTTGNQTISGFKSFINPSDTVVSRFEGPNGAPLEIVTADEQLSVGYGGTPFAIGVGNDGFAIKYSSSEFDWGQPILVTEGGATVVRPTSTITFPQSVLAPNLVYTTDNQTISGIKTFASRLTVNGTGVLLSGEVTAQLPNTIVYTTGDQLIDGTKTFTSSNTIFGGGSLRILFSDNTYSNELGFMTSDDEVLAVRMSDGNFQYGGGLPGNAPLSILNNITTFTNRPTVNGTGILLSGEGGGTATLPTTIVYTTGDQTISGIKTFSSRPQVNTTGVILSNTINDIITLTQAEYDAIGSPVSTTLYIITDP